MAMKPCKECKREVSTSAKACPNCGVERPTGGLSTGMGCLIIILLLAVLGQVSRSGGGAASSSYSESPRPSARDTKRSTIDAVDLQFSWSKGGFDSVMEATFTITNNGARDVKDIEVTCTHTAPSGTQIDSNVRTIFEVFPAHKKRRIPNFNMGFIHNQAAASACRITDLVVL